MNTCVFENGTDCNALRCKNCENCAFRKTREELIEGREKAIERIDNLPVEQRNHIIRKYYLGRRRAFSI